MCRRNYQSYVDAEETLNAIVGMEKGCSCAIEQNGFLSRMTFRLKVAS